MYVWWTCFIPLLKTKPNLLTGLLLGNLKITWYIYLDLQLNVSSSLTETAEGNYQADHWTRDQCIQGTSAACSVGGQKWKYATQDWQRQQTYKNNKGGYVVKTMLFLFLTKHNNPEYHATMFCLHHVPLFLVDVQNCITYRWLCACLWSKRL